ncbi:putative transmembrane transport protein [Patulibacter medicamentivorans]|uniref:Putative transmembrane transport protein n=1 Tax=Patulibacter medicamentivorans TaxID=1097667 RepID=H0E6X6_9ACTN|nr:transporter [Patulibacter medicamentivorans]EHN10558.1 putative transmembrane transport protein [Patulibacter medicamentivorans]
MIWVAWRQQRTEVLLGALLLAALVVLFVPAGLHMSDAYRSDGAAACVAVPAGGCEQLLDAFDGRFSTVIGVTGFFAFLPVVIAVVFAAPFALELERGTYRLAWTQSITRQRWLAAKLAVALGGTAVTAAGIALLLTWWRRPLDHFHGRIEPGAFQLEGIAPIAYAVFAAALIIALGAVLRRTIAAIAVSIVAFLAVRITIETSVRPHFASPLEARPGTNLDTSWIVDGRMHHPSSRFWEFQGIETGIFLALTLVLLALAAWWIHERSS